VAVNPISLVGRFFGRFFGNTIGEAAAFGIGGALREPLHPLLQELTNTTWETATAAGVSKPLDLLTAAEVAAEEVDKYDSMQTQASYSGFDSSHFQDAYRVTLTAPGFGTLLQLLRREAEVPVDFTHGLRKAKLADQWDTALRNLASERLTPAQLALGIVRSVVDDPGLQVGANDTAGGVVPAYPVSSIDTLAEALTGGIDKERLRVMVGEIGLPMSLQQAASAYFRKIIELPDFYKAVAQGDTRPAWGPFILEQARQIPTAHDGIEARLRGWIKDADMYAQTARHGMSKADTDLLFKVLGRPLSFHQVFIGERRGGVYDGPTDQIDPHFLKSLQESNIRPEWYNLAWAQRYNYPTAFVLRALTEAGDLTQQEAHDILLFEGWEPTLAEKVSTKWAGGTGATTDAHVSKAQTQLWTTTHRSYIAEEIDDAVASSALTAAGVEPAAVSPILALWGQERSLIRAQLTPKEIAKAVRTGVINPATGVAWTLQEGITALLARGYTQADAEVILQE
jgi:hypothetical protein